VGGNQTGEGIRKEIPLHHHLPNSAACAFAHLIAPAQSDAIGAVWIAAARRASADAAEDAAA
jgi:hypothetical protein